LKTYLIVIAAVLALMACATKRESNSLPLEQGRAVKFTIPRQLVGEMSDAALISRYAEGIRGATAYRLEHREGNQTETVGVRVTPSAAGVNVAYVHSYDPKLYHNYVADFGVTTKRQENDVVVDVACPDAMHIASASLTGLYSAFIEEGKAMADLRAICSRAQMIFERRESGEVDVPFNDSAVYTNFKRKLSSAADVRSDVRQGELAKFTWFYVKDGTRTRTVGVTVFPYRSGSKVTWVWLNGISCRPNGACDFDPAASKRIAEAIAAVAND